jgi:hypothetical protein
MAEHTREEVDAKLAAAEARTDTKIARIEGKLDLVLEKLTNVGEQIRTTDAHGREDNRSTRANIWVVGVSLGILIAAIAALFPVFFGLGTQIKDMIDHAIDTHIQDTQPPKKP